MSKNLIVFFILFTTLSANAQVTLNLKLFIEGYYTGNGLMNNYGSGGCLLFSGISSNPNDGDTITVSLAVPQNLSIVESQSGIFQIDGTISLNFSQVSPGNSYFIRITHRSAIETWSALPIVMQSTTSYDFTTGSAQAYGSNMVEVQPGKWAFFSGDITDVTFLGLGLCNQDKVIDTNDYAEMEDAVRLILYGYKCQDITGDGIVEPADYLLMENAVAVHRHAMIPQPIYVNEISIASGYPTIYKCISIDGKLNISFNIENRRCSIFSMEGKMIYKFGKEKPFNNNLQMQDGFYILMIEEK